MRSGSAGSYGARTSPSIPGGPSSAASSTCSIRAISKRSAGRTRWGSFPEDPFPMRIDVNAFLGRYPFRDAPGGSPKLLLELMDRVGTTRAWVSNLSALFWKDPTEGNSIVYQAADREPRFRPVPAVHPE